MLIRLSKLVVLLSCIGKISSVWHLDGCIGPRRSDETHTVGPTQVTYSIRTGNLAHLGYPKCMDTSLRAQRLV